MSLRLRRAIHFASFCMVVLGILCIGFSIWMALYLQDDAGFLLAVEGFMASIFFVLLGLVAKLHATLHEYFEPSAPRREGETGLGALVKRAKESPRDGYAFWSAGLILAGSGTCFYVVLGYVRFGTGKLWLTELGYVAAVARHLFVGWCFLVDVLLLMALQCLLSTLVLQLQARKGRGERSKAGPLTQISGAPSL